MKIINFFGPDGSGKTTLANYLMRYFLSKNMPVRLVWMRGTHTFASILSLFLVRFSNLKGNDNTYYNIKIPKRMIRLWWIVEFVSILPILLQRFVIPSFLGFIIIAERCLVDFVVWNVITTKSIKFLTSIFGRFFTIYMYKRGNKSFKLIYIKANVSSLLERKPEDKKRLEIQLALYNVLANYLDACIVDTTNKKLKDAFQEILVCIEAESNE